LKQQQSYLDSGAINSVGFRALPKLQDYIPNVRMLHEVLNDKHTYIAGISGIPLEITVVEY
jgi:hypothetical protein